MRSCKNLQIDEIIFGLFSNSCSIEISFLELMLYYRVVMVGVRFERGWTYPPCYVLII